LPSQILHFTKLLKVGSQKSEESNFFRGSKTSDSNFRLPTKNLFLRYEFHKKQPSECIYFRNLFSGCVGIVHLFSGDYHTTAICIIISLILDFFDGFIARAMNSSSNLGGQLDSLADMVSFGFLPGFTMFIALVGNFTQIFLVLLFGFLITLFSCLRLAIFNLDEEQNIILKDLNTPSNTILIFGLFYFKEPAISSFL
jgi:CDP-diacylglycerol--serine O-phosphatidyltransferase